MLTYLLPLLPALLTVGLGYYLNRRHHEHVAGAAKHAKEIEEMFRDIENLEEGGHAVNLRLVAIEAHAKENENRQLRLETDMRDIRENMARRTDIEALSERLRDVLARCTRND